MKYNDTLKALHEQKREETIKIVLEAIDVIKGNEGEDANLTASKLALFTGLSRVLFYKSHILKLWNPSLWEQKYNMKQDKLDKQKDAEINDLRNQITKISSELQRCQTRIKKLELDIENERKRKEVYQLDMEDYKDKYQRAIGEITRLQQRLIAVGYDD